MGLVCNKRFQQENAPAIQSGKGFCNDPVPKYFLVPFFVCPVLVWLDDVSIFSSYVAHRLGRTVSCACCARCCACSTMHEKR